MLYKILGWVGMGLALAAYFLVSNGVLIASGKPYQFMNLVGAFFLIINAYKGRAWPFVALNAVWGSVALVALFRVYFLMPR
jgi:hypothetical protein